MAGFSIVKLLDGINNVVVTSGMVPKGAYSAGTDYAVGDLVSYQGSSYIMYVDAVAGTAPTDTTKWMILAEGYNITVSASAPGTPFTGQLWVDVS